MYNFLVYQSIEFEILAGISAIFLFSFTSVLSKHILSQINAPFHYFRLQILYMLPVFLTIFFTTANLSILAKKVNIYFMDLILAATFSFAGMLTLMLGFRDGNASTGGIFLSTRVIFSIPLAIIFLGEIHPVHVYAVIGIILLGGLLTAYDREVPWTRIIQGKEKGVRWFVLTSFFWAISNFYTTRVTQAIAPFEYLSLRIIIFGILILLSSPMAKLIDYERINPKQSLRPHIMVFVVLTIAGQFLFVIALKFSLTLAEGIGVFEGVLTFLVSITLTRFTKIDSLNESLDGRSLMVRSIGAILATLGVFSLVVF